MKEIILNKDNINIWVSSDVKYAVNRSIKTAKNLGFTSRKINEIAIIVSELSRNIIKYASTGTITVNLITNCNKKGLEVIAEDYGPGIKDINLAMKEGYSSTGTLGMGLSAIKNMSDEFIFDNSRNIGSKFNIIKWL